MTENEKKLIEGLINQDEKVTRGFFGCAKTYDVPVILSADAHISFDIANYECP